MPSVLTMPSNNDYMHAGRLIWFLQNGLKCRWMTKRALWKGGVSGDFSTEGGVKIPRRPPGLHPKHKKASYKSHLSFPTILLRYNARAHPTLATRFDRSPEAALKKTAASRLKCRRRKISNDDDN